MSAAATNRAANTAVWQIVWHPVAPACATDLTVEKHVAEGGAVALDIGGQRRQRPHVVLQQGGEEEAWEGGLVKVKAGPWQKSTMQSRSGPTCSCGSSTMADKPLPSSQHRTDRHLSHPQCTHHPTHPPTHLQLRLQHNV